MSEVVESSDSVVPATLSPGMRCRRVAIQAVVVVALHQGLIALAARMDIFSAFLSAGSHVPVAQALLLLTLLVVRIFAVLFLPGLILTHLGLALFDYLSPGTAESSTRT